MSGASRSAPKARCATIVCSGRRDRALRARAASRSAPQALRARAASFRRRLAIALGSVALLAAASGARAADAPAGPEQLFEHARLDMKRGDFAAARDKLLASLNLEATAGTLFNLGLCEEKLGLLRDSLGHLRAALTRAGEDDKRRPVMAALIESLEQRVGRVVIERFETGGVPLQVTLDGRALHAAAGAQEIVVDPGEHELVVTGPGGPPQTTPVRVNEGQTVIQVIAWRRGADPATAAPRPLVSTSPLRAGDRTRGRVGAIAVNAGGAAVIAGGLLGFMTWGRKISADHHCSATSCDDEGLRASAEGARYSTASTALTVAGLASLGIGSYLLLRPTAAPDRRASAGERKVGIIAGSVGAAALVASAIAGGVALSAKRELLYRCGDSGPCNDPAGLDAAARGQTASTIATVALGVGLAGLGVASYTLLLRPRFAPATDVRLTLSPSTIACTATF
jgi:hypothetical protein